MSIIEKALEKLEKTERGVGGRPSSSDEKHLATPAGSDVAVSVDAELSVEAPDVVEAIPPAPRTSKSLDLDLKRLRRAGILTDGSSDRQLLEQYRLLKHSVLRRAFDQQSGKPNGQRNIVMVTSAVQGEGKTFTSINLAMTVAKEVNHSVLLIDGDMIRRGMSRLCGVDNRPGLVDYLKSQNADLSEFLLKTNIDSLTLLPAGAPTEEISELAASVRMRRLVQELASRYRDRLVLIDTPPLLRDSSALVFASLVGQIALVVEAEKTPQHVVQDALETLPVADGVGIILNKSNQRFKSEYEYGYY